MSPYCRMMLSFKLGLLPMAGVFYVYESKLAEDPKMTICGLEYSIQAFIPLENGTEVILQVDEVIDGFDLYFELIGIPPGYYELGLENIQDQDLNPQYEIIINPSFIFWGFPVDEKLKGRMLIQYTAFDCSELKEKLVNESLVVTRDEDGVKKLQFIAIVNDNESRSNNE